jgi:queuine/archaeosine tRNA-ribosyltransferase
VANIISPDIAFSFDETAPEGDIDEVTERIILNFREDENAIRPRDFPLCPIVHLPGKYEGTLAECAPRLIAKVTSELNPVMVAIPERELGDGLIERFKSVRDIRRALNELGKYYPIHLLGTGNPISMIAFAAAGADSFDGLEWCRTVADYNNGHMFHFQHFDCFNEQYLSRIQSPEIRKIITDPGASYVARVACYNLDFFNDWSKTMQDMIATDQIEHLLKNVPNIGNMLFEELMK